MIDPSPDQPQQQRLIWLGRAIWWVLAISSIYLFLIAVPVYFDQLNHVCFRPPCLAMQLNLGKAITLELAGLSFALYARIIVLIQVLVYVANIAIGIFIFVRKKNDWIAILVSLILLTSIQADMYRGLLAIYPQIALPARLLGLTNSVLLIVFFYIFPTGNFRPRWTLGLAAFWVVLLFLSSIYPVFSITSQISPTVWFVLFLTCLIGSSLGVLVYRYRSIFTPRQRIQSKWVVYGIAVTWAGELLLELIRLTLPVFENNALLLIAWNILAISWTLILPLSIFIAVLSSALLDIDILIRRTLAYTFVTITLVLVYIGSIFLFQKMFEVLTGQRSPLVAIASTLVIAALFNPLMQRIRISLDLFFSRNSYNVDQVVNDFSESVREDVDLDEVSTHLVSLVRHTLQPEFISLWSCRVSPDKDINDENQIR